MPKEENFKVKKAILSSASLTAEQLQKELNYLGKTLGDNIHNITSKNLDNINQIRTLHYVAESLRYFQDNSTIDKFLKLFNNPEEVSSHLPTLFFSRYILKDHGKIKFEPEYTDVKLLSGKEIIFFELKRPRLSEDISEFQKENKELVESVRDILDDRFQYDITYKKEEDVDKIPAILREELDCISSKGKTMLTDSVELSTREKSQSDPNAPNIGITLFGFKKDLDSNKKIPQATYISPDSVFSIAGPELNEEKKLKRLVKKGRKQIEKKDPAVIVIQIGDLMGSLNKLKKAVQELFQKEKNTRISAVLLFTYYFSSGGIEADIRKIKNPYAVNPLPEKIDDILYERDNEDITDID